MEKQSRRRFQFALGTMLNVLLLVSLFMGLIYYRLEVSKLERQVDAMNADSSEEVLFRQGGEKMYYLLDKEAAKRFVQLVKERPKSATSVEGKPWGIFVILGKVYHWHGNSIRSMSESGPSNVWFDEGLSRMVEFLEKRRFSYGPSEYDALFLEFIGGSTEIPLVDSQGIDKNSSGETPPSPPPSK